MLSAAAACAFGREQRYNSGPCVPGLVKEGENTVQIPKKPRKQVLRVMRGMEPKAGVGIEGETRSNISRAIVDFACGYASRLLTCNNVVKFSWS